MKKLIQNISSVNKTKIFLALIMLVTINFSSHTINAQWKYVGTPGFSSGSAYNQSLSFNDSIPYVAYRDGVNGYKTSVMTFDGTNWVYVGSPGFSGGPADYQCLALDGDTPYVAFQEENTGGSGGGTTVMKYDGTNWINVGLPNFNEGLTAYHSLLIINHIPYVAFMDGAYSYKTVVKKI